ncbi:hypothetical protein SDC9_186229 [bioreactor metagenome]|uniref:Uncharacterized protein n=1 Tax=bioreactor metagenome TaxID=1076179 RepID=A0A645HRD9_9ZZZZ
MYLDALLPQQLRQLAIHDHQLHQRGAAKTVHIAAHRVAGLDVAVFQQFRQQGLYNFVGGLHFNAPDARLAVDAKAVLHLVRRQAEDRVLLAGDRRPLKAHADRPGVVARLFSHTAGFGQRQAGAGGPRNFQHKHIARNAAAVSNAVFRGRGHVVPHPHRFGGDALLFQFFCRFVKV